MSTDCFICRISQSATSSLNGDDLPSYDRAIVSDELFVAFPSLGQFVEGYLLLSPHQHESVMNLGLLSQECIFRFQEFKNRVATLLSSEYGAPIFFEHGAVSPETLPPCCTEHSHLHAIPMQLTEPPAAVTDVLRGGRISSFAEVMRWAQARKPYFYLELSDGSQYLYEADDLPSQFGRRVIAELLGLPDEWDWAGYPYFKKMEDTYRRLCQTTCEVA